MNFIAKIVPVLVLLGLILVHPLVAVIATVIYVGWKWAELGDKAHIGALAREAGSDLGWAHRSAEENLSDGILYVKKVNAEGKLAFVNSDTEYAEGYTKRYQEVAVEYSGTRKEYRAQTQAALDTALTSLNH